MMNPDAAGLERLLRRASRRQPDALQEITRLYSRRVYGLIFRMIGSRDAAEELTQDTFLRVVKTIAEYNHDGKFEAWLFRIAANLARDRLRRIKRRGSSLSLDAERDDDRASRVFEPADERPTPDRTAEMNEDEERLRHALNGLSDMDREIILLRHYSELPFGEIAVMLNVPLGTALARAHRALNKLKSALENLD